MQRCTPLKLSGQSDPGMQRYLRNRHTCTHTHTHTDSLLLQSDVTGWGYSWHVKHWVNIVAIHCTSNPYCVNLTLTLGQFFSLIYHIVLPQTRQLFPPPHPQRLGHADVRDAFDEVSWLASDRLLSNCHCCPPERFMPWTTMPRHAPA